jgi:3-deoxy-D-manno-octulosonic acid (KDO) 8-phosphate synthase
MIDVADKLVRSGNIDVLLCERGASFGYNTLVSDMRAIPILHGFPFLMRPFSSATGRARDALRRPAAVR